MSDLRVEHLDDAVVARPTFDIDTANAAAVQNALAGCLDRDSDHLILDLGEVAYLDSAGVDMLLRLSERLHDRRSELLLVVPRSSSLTRIVEIVDLPAAVAVYPTLADALAGCARTSG